MYIFTYGSKLVTLPVQRACPVVIWTHFTVFVCTVLCILHECVHIMFICYWYCVAIYNGRTGFPLICTFAGVPEQTLGCCPLRQTFCSCLPVVRRNIISYNVMYIRSLSGELRTNSRHTEVSIMLLRGYKRVCPWHLSPYTTSCWASITTEMYMYCVCAHTSHSHKHTHSPCSTKCAHLHTLLTGCRRKV